MLGVLTSARQCSGVDGIAVNLMVISGGTGDWELFTRESEVAKTVVQCHTSGNYTRPSQNSTCS